MKPYLFEYRYHHQEHTFEIYAEDLDDAHKRLLAIRQHAHFKASGPDHLPKPKPTDVVTHQDFTSKEFTWLGNLLIKLGLLFK
jgi:hypothetical protein